MIKNSPLRAIKYSLIPLVYLIAKLDEDGNVKSLNKRLNYRPQKPNTSSFGLESFRSLGPRIWELIADNVKLAKSFSALKNALKKLNIDKFPWKI